MAYLLKLWNSKNLTIPNAGENDNNRNSYPWLMGMQTDKATLEGTLQFFIKLRYTLNIWSSKFISKYLPKELKT